MPRINSKQSSTVKIQIEGQSDDSDQDEEKRTRERRGKVAKREKPSEIEVCSCPTCSRLFMRQRNEQVRRTMQLPLAAKLSLFNTQGAIR